MEYRVSNCLNINNNISTTMNEGMVDVEWTKIIMS